MVLDTHLHAEPLLLCIILEFLFMALLEYARSNPGWRNCNLATYLYF